MPILWRFIIPHFLKTVLGCVCAFISILMTMRFDEIAHFAGLGAPLSSVLMFTFYQIPYILPISIPLSCLIASMILIQRLSTTHELTALRACGFSLRDILAPILLTAVLLGILNFWIVSEVATQSHLRTNLLKSQLRSINPLLLLHNKHLMRLKGFYFDALGTSRVGESAGDVVFAMPGKSHQRMFLLLAKKLKSTPTTLIGQQLTMLSGSVNQGGQFDDLLVENIGHSISNVEDFAQVLQKKVWSFNNDQLHMSLLLIRADEQLKELERAKVENKTQAEIKPLKYQLNRSINEVTKRFSIALATFSFTLMGCAFGINIGRRKQRLGLILSIFLTTFFLLCFFSAKGLEHQLILSISLYLCPHIVIILSSILVLNRISKGIE